MVFGVLMIITFYHSCLDHLSSRVSRKGRNSIKTRMGDSLIYLIDHKYIRPKSIHDQDTVEEFSKSYMYLACIQFINQVKTSASLRWHSPMLDDISACKTWIKVNQGMIKMYKAEVLGKLPIMQHFMFGSLINFEGGVDNAEEEEDECGHNHHQDTFAKGQEYPDCCGIPVPSAIAAAASRSRSQRPIPFD